MLFLHQGSLTIIPRNNATPSPSLFSYLITQSTVAKVICSFHNGSIGGLDGLSPQYLKYLIGPSAGEGGLLLLIALTSLVSLILRGDTPFLFVLISLVLLL